MDRPRLRVIADPGDIRIIIPESPSSESRLEDEPEHHLPRFVLESIDRKCPTAQLVRILICLRQTTRRLLQNTSNISVVMNLIRGVEELGLARRIEDCILRLDFQRLISGQRE